jgi:hypothetical protein
MSSANFEALVASENNHGLSREMSKPLSATMPALQINKLKRYFAKDRLPPPRLTTRIRLQNDLVVVHPRTEAIPLDPIDESSETGLGVPDDTLLFGHASIAADPYITIHSVRVGLVVVYRYKLASTDEKPRETVIFEQYKSFSSEEILVTPKDSSNLVHRRINFDILVPASLPTYEHSAHGIILPQVRVTVEYGYDSMSREVMDTIAASPPAAAVEQSEEGSLILGRRIITDRWQGGGTVYVPRSKSRMV